MLFENGWGVGEPLQMSEVFDFEGVLRTSVTRTRSLPFIHVQNGNGENFFGRGIVLVGDFYPDGMLLSRLIVQRSFGFEDSARIDGKGSVSIEKRKSKGGSRISIVGGEGVYGFTAG